MQQGTYGAVAAFRDETGQEHPWMSQWWMGFAASQKCSYKEIPYWDAARGSLFRVVAHIEFHNVTAAFELFFGSFCNISRGISAGFIISLIPHYPLHAVLLFAHTPNPTRRLPSKRSPTPGRTPRRLAVITVSSDGNETGSFRAPVPKRSLDRRKAKVVSCKILQLSVVFFLVQNLIGELKLCLLWWMKYVKLNELKFLFPFSKLYSILLFSREPFWEAKRCLREIKLLKMLDHENVIELFQALDFHLIKFFKFALHFHLQKWMRTIREMAETNHRLHPWNLNMIPWKIWWLEDYLLSFWDWTIFRGEVWKNFQGVPIGTPPGGTYRRNLVGRFWRLHALFLTRSIWWRSCVMLTSITVINSDTPLSTLL